MDLTDKQRNLLDYLTEEIQTKGLPPTVSEICKALGFKSKNAAAKLLKCLEGKGLVRTTGKARGIEVLSEEGQPVCRGMVSVPVLGRITAGMPMLAEEQVEDWLKLPMAMTARRKNTFLLKVQGMSMKDAGILDGDLVLVKMQNEALPNDIVVALLHDEATVKRLIKNGSKYYLKAENKEYPNIYPQEEWTIQGKVISVIRNIQ